MGGLSERKRANPGDRAATVRRRVDQLSEART